ncbi:MAG TPA: TolC family protein [Methylophilaceae bacterium]|jgi:cobalt-zinc-cadmium efflux system outer membrane protein
MKVSFWACITGVLIASLYQVAAYADEVDVKNTQAVNRTEIESSQANLSNPNLGSLSLKDAEQLFKQNNRELLAAQRAVEASQANTLSAGQKPNPVLSFGVSSIDLNRNRANANPNKSTGILNDTYNSSVQISQLFERGDKRNLRLASAETAVKAAKFDLKDTLRQQQLALQSAYYDLLLAQDSLQIQQTNVDLYEKTLQAADLRLKAGDIAASDVARIRVDALRAKNDLRQAVANQQKAQANLAYLIGREQVANTIIAKDTWPAVQDSATLALDEKSIAQRPDVQAAETRTQQAIQNRRLAEALKTRDINLGMGYQHFPGQEPGAGENTIGATVSIPLFTNYQYQGEIARAENDYTSALEAKEQTSAAALGEVERAKADLDAAVDKVRRFDTQMLSEAQQAADAAEFAYQHGAMGVTDLLDSRRILRALQLDAVSVRADYAKSLAVWQAATHVENNP